MAKGEKGGVWILMIIDEKRILFLVWEDVPRSFTGEARWGGWTCSIGRGFGGDGIKYGYLFGVETSTCEQHVKKE